MKYILIIFIFFGCSRFYSKNEIVQKDTLETEYNTVNLGSPKVWANPQIKSTEFVESSIGPYPSIGQESQVALRKKNGPIVGMIFGPGLHKAVAHIVLIKHLRKKNIKIHLLSGHGLGAVIAAMYASGMTTQKMEWLFFKFFNEAKGEAVFSTKWLKLLDEIVISRIKSKTLQELETTTYLPSSRKINGLYGSGNLRNILRSHLKRFSDKIMAYNMIEKTNFFSHKFFKKLGVNLLLGIDVINGDVSFQSTNEHLGTIFSEISSKIESEKILKKELIIGLSSKGFDMDSYDDPMPYMKEAEKQSALFVNDIADMVKHWDKNPRKE
ncbi:MAG: hypothetical protein ACO20H_02505 [Bacteriovoracaceae bacterium]